MLLTLFLLSLADEAGGSIYAEGGACTTWCVVIDFVAKENIAARWTYHGKAMWNEFQDEDNYMYILMMQAEM